MRFSVVFERVQEAGFPSGYYYAHLPSLGLTTHGLRINGARQAAADLVQLWLREKLTHGEEAPGPAETFFGTLEISEDALQSA